MASVHIERDRCVAADEISLYSKFTAQTCYITGSGLEDCLDSVKKYHSGVSGGQCSVGDYESNQTNPSREAQSGHPVQTSLCVNSLRFDNNELKG